MLVKRFSISRQVFGLRCAHLLSALLCVGAIGTSTTSAYSQPTIITLDFDTLPSAQGWAYQGNDLNMAPVPFPETEATSVDGTKMTLDTFGEGLVGAFYSILNVVPVIPFSLLLRARVLQDENENGFLFQARTGVELYRISLDTNSVRAASNPVVPIDGTVFHDFRMDITPGVGFTLLVDGQPVDAGLRIGQSLAFSRHRSILHLDAHGSRRTGDDLGRGVDIVGVQVLHLHLSNLSDLGL